ncbi:glutathione peroxidase [Abyssicoccus albus]|uniref:glutathione peroxidase n=1 Tax=Abyssicoccus albus TaxID=1817405 RepID=UPI00097E377A|nr:glutathione peroxidase [Abyssicoccus albus]AQL55524.1 glutathione peroxidase [Abyssicoccus albus]
MTQSIYDIKVATVQGETYELSKYKDKVMIIVNTASKCGLTPQFEGLQHLYDSYKDQGLVILGFPCNQFANQEPGNAEEAESLCQLNYGVTFPMHEKIYVNGDNTHPLFEHLKSEQKGLFGSAIKWNFTKFVISRDGQVVKRFSPKDDPKSMKETIESLL